MTLLLQLNGDLPERFPHHDRRLYIFVCKQAACRRKARSIRALRSIRITQKKASAEHKKSTAAARNDIDAKKTVISGESLFGASFAIPSAIVGNPFSTTPTSPLPSSANTASKSSSTQSAGEDLSHTFAAKARINDNPLSLDKTVAQALATEKVVESPPWPEIKELPQPYAEHYLDAEYETLEKITQPSTTSYMNLGEAGAGENQAFDKVTFESKLDKHFQRFADRVSQNPEQLLRYEFGGSPLLYNDNDSVGEAFRGCKESASNNKVQTQSHLHEQNIPSCTRCGAQRTFELQLMPHAIAMLESDDLGMDGMDWGTIILGVCSADCAPEHQKVDMVDYVEEWVGVQWE